MGSFIKAALGFIIIGAVFVGCVRSYLGLNSTAPESSSGIKEISFANSSPIELETGDSRWKRFSVEHRGDDILMDDIVFVSSDESVATITFDKKQSDRLIYCYINAISEGTATVYVESTDGVIRSEEIVVTVTESTTTDRQSDVTENE